MIDSRSDVPAPAVLDDVRVIIGGEVIATQGARSLRSITVRTPGGTETIEADALGVSGGWNPNVHLTCHLGGRPAWDETIAAFVPQSAPKRHDRRRRRQRDHDARRLPRGRYRGGTHARRKSSASREPARSSAESR